MDRSNDPKMPAMPDSLSLLRGVNLIFASTLTAESEEELGEICLAVAEELTESAIGFIAEIAADGMLRYIAISGLGWDECQLVSESERASFGRRCPVTGLLEHVLKTGAPVLANDPTSHPASVGVRSGHPELGAFLSAPMRRAGEVVGLISVANRTGGYAPEDASTLETIAAASAAAIYTIRAERAIETELSRVSLLRDAATIAAATLDPDEICRQTLDACMRHLGATTCGIHVADEEGANLVACALRGVSDEIGERLAEIAFRDPSGTAVAFRTNAVVTHESEQVPQASRDREAALGLQSERLVAVPIRVGEMPLGVLTMSFAGRRPFEPAEIDIFQALADQLGVGVEKGRLFVREHTYRQREAALREVAQVSSESLQPGPLARRITRTIAELLGAKQAQIRLVNDEGIALCSAGEFDPSGFLQAMGDMPVGADTITAGCFRQCEAAFGGEIGESVSEASRRNSQDAGVRSYAVVPVCVDDRPIGVLYLGWDEPRRFSADEREFLEALTAQCAVGVNNARLFEAEKRASTVNRAMSAVSEVLAATLDVEAAMPRVLAILAELFGASGAFLAYDEAATLAVRQAWGKHERLSGERYAYEQMPVVSGVLADGRPVFVGDVERELGDAASALVHPGARGAIVAYPMVLRSDVVGTIVFSFAAPREFGGEFRALMARVAYLLSAAMESSRIYQTEHVIAETLQEMLVAVPASVPGLVFSRAYQSATAEAGRVGGDFLDVFEIREGLAGVTIGDVSGKGVAAAALTSLVRNAIRAYALEGLGASEICERTNAVLRRFTETETYVTLFFALICTQTGLVRYVSAGHQPAILLRPDGTCEEFAGARCPILGAFDDTPVFEAQAVLGNGDRLILYTDGVTEARAPGGTGFWRIDGLKASLERHSSAAAENLADLVIADVLQHSNGVLRDDAALLVVEPVGAT
jgi:GAF domain-containing protein